MNFNLDVINILVVLVALVNTVYGLVVYSRNRNDATNISFFILTLAVSAWGFSMFAFRGFSELTTVVWAARILYVSAAAIPLAFLYFVFIFPNEKYTPTEQQKYLLHIPFFIITALALWPNTLIQSVRFIPQTESFIVFNPTHHLIYALYIVGYFGAGYFLLFKRLRDAGGVYRQQILYIITGTLIATTIGIATNLVLPLLGIFALNWIGQIGVVAMIVAISYAILKHHLFNIRVITAEVLMASLWVFIFIRTFTSDDPQEQLSNSVILAVIILVGIWLIKNVRKTEEMATELAESNKRQENLIHLISHEVKNGLGKANDVFAEIVEGTYDTDQKLLKETTATALKDNRKVVAQVEDVLNSENFKTGKVRYEMKSFDLREALQESAEKYKPEAEEKGLVFMVQDTGSEPYRIYGDREQIVGHVLKNLLENAINFTPSGTIAVQLSRTNGIIRLSVTDTGVGITAEDKARLFTEGGHGKESIKINVHSTGYGLFIAKQIVEAHHGKIWAESAGSGKGATFFVELPVINS